uniref:Reverse transcriptase domain-containing protein n=1 Tax=Xenopus tropicalis TaxID=8364 RepID=A0A803K361_XENTR
MSQIGFTVVSWNTRGLNDKVKRSIVLNILRKSGADIIMLQETHLIGQRIRALKRHWVPIMYHAEYSSYSRGVAVLIRRSLGFCLEQLITDPGGRYLLVKGQVEGRPYLFVNVYLPPPADIHILHEITQKVAHFGHIPTLWAGDFNMVMDPHIDRLRPNVGDTLALAQWASALSLTDTWRWRNPDARQYSCYTRASAALSRIDLVLVTPELLQGLTSSKFLPRVCSDHAPLLAAFKWDRDTRSSRWRLSPKWIQHKYIAEKYPPLLAQYWDANEGTTQPNIVWDAGKAYSRGMYISLIKQARQKCEESLMKAQDKLTQAEAAIAEDDTDQNAHRLNECQRDVNLLYTEKYTQTELYRAAHWYDKGDKNSKLLAMLARGETPYWTIRELLLEDGAMTTLRTEMVDRFARYYQTLYDFQPDQTNTGLAALLNTIDIPTLAEPSATELDRDISPEEVTEAINSLPGGKAPGPDGLPSEWYKQHLEFIAPKLCSLYNEVTPDSLLPDSCYEAHITLIPKEGKPPQKCESYRPISLFNCDVKIFAKILALRLRGVIRDLVHPDQTGFMPARATDINIRRLFNNLCVRHQNSGTRVVVALDTEKAFDTVYWPYLWEVLQWFGLGPRFVGWIRALYARPQAKIMVAGMLSTVIYLKRGTRQGCPLSPLLFSLAIEPLAIQIRESKEIIGLQLGDLEEKVSLYADDMLLYLADPKNSLQALIRVLTNFGKHSGLKVNYDKSLVFPIDNLPQSILCSITQLNTVSEFRYLGIQIHKELKRYEQLNISPVLARLKEKTLVWQNLPLSVPGKINLLKMVFLPKFLYVFHNAPVVPPKTFFKALDSVIRGFIWSGERPRMSFQTLQAPLTGGGLALPNFEKYFLASQLVYVHWWTVPRLDNRALVLEAAIVGSLEALAKLPYRGISPYYQTTLPIKTVVESFQRALKVVQNKQPVWSKWTPI